MAAVSLISGDVMEAYCDYGTGWVKMAGLTCAQANGSFIGYSYNVPQGCKSFKLRFKLTTIGASRYGYVDDIVLTGVLSYGAVRTVVYIQKETVTGQFIFIKGGHDAGLVPSVYPPMSEPITYCNMKNPDSSTNKAIDGSLDWFDSSSLDWTCNIWPAAWGTKKTYAVDGYGEDPENQWGLHYWKFDVMMDGNAGEWFEFKSFMRQGDQTWWESDISQPNTPYKTINHWGKKGYITVVTYGLSNVAFYPLSTNTTNTAPAANFTVSPVAGDISTVFSFDASSCSDSQDATTSLQVRWDFNGDGTYETSYSTVKTASYTYNATGAKNAVLQVLDGNGSTSTKTVQINVIAGGTNNYPGVYSGRKGANLYADGVEFSTWWRSSQVDKVCVAGTFNAWALKPLSNIGGDVWVGFVAGVKAGDEYKIVGIKGNTTNWLQDIYGGYTKNTSASDMGNSVVVDHSAFNWTDGSWKRPGWDSYIIYELHVADFTANNPSVAANRRGTYLGVADMMPYLANLGITAIELMPCCEGAFSDWWGYNTSTFMSPESSFGTGQPNNGWQTCNEFKQMVNTAHQYGIAVVMDMVFNHTGGANPFWTMDQVEYFDWNNDGVVQANPGQPDNTPWGNHFCTWKQSVKNYGLEACDYWARLYHIDGFRYDAANTQFLSGDFVSYLKSNLESRYPGIITILESLPLQSDHNLKGPQWCQPYYRNGRAVLTGSLAVDSVNYNNYNQSFVDNMNASKGGSAPYSFSPWHVVNYFESHDESSIGGYIGNNAAAIWKVRLSAAALVASKGLPMIFMGQEYAFSRVLPDSGSGRVIPRPLDWGTFYTNNKPVYDYCSGLFGLRKKHLNLREMNSDQVFAYNPYGNVVGYRFSGAGDNTIIVLLNFGGDRSGFGLGCLGSGAWKMVAGPDTFYGENSSVVKYSSDSVYFNGSSAMVFMQ